MTGKPGSISVPLAPQRSAGRKDDNGKLRFDLIPPEALAQVAAVLTHGAKKYGANNWRRVKSKRSRYTAALMRHLEAWRSGEIQDPESGLHHLAHVLTNGFFLLTMEVSSEKRR